MTDHVPNSNINSSTGYPKSPPSIFDTSWSYESSNNSIDSTCSQFSDVQTARGEGEGVNSMVSNPLAIPSLDNNDNNNHLPSQVGNLSV